MAYVSFGSFEEMMDNSCNKCGLIYSNEAINNHRQECTSTAVDEAVEFLAVKIESNIINELKKELEG